MKDSPFALIGVNSDRDRKRLKQRMEEEDISWRSFWNGGSTRGPISTAWSVRAWPTIYVLDGQGVIRFKNVRGQALDRAVNELVEKELASFAQRLDNKDPAARGLAAYRAGKYKAPETKAKLAELLHDTDAVVRRRAALGLALWGQPVEPMLALVRKSAGDDRPDVRADSLTVLAEVGDEKSAALAIEAVDDQDAHVRRTAVAVLGKFKSPEVVPALAKAAGDADARIAKAAVLSLADAGSPRAKELIRKLAVDSQHPARVWIALAMHRVGESGTEPRFAALLKDKDAEIRRQAVATLDQLAGFDPLSLYIQALDDEDTEVRKVAGTWLSRSEDPRAQKALEASLAPRIDGLLEGLAAADYRKQREASEGLRQLGPAAAPLLLDRLNQPKSMMARYYLAQAIAQLNNPAVIQPVVQQLKDPQLDPQLRPLLEQILSRFGDEARDVVEGLVRDKESAARESGARLLWRFRDARATELLTSILNDPSPRVRVYAAAGLAPYKPDAALATLKQSVREDDPLVRRTASLGLAQLDAGVALPVLAKLENDPDRGVRRNLVFLLGNFREKRATELIAKLARDDPGTRLSAVRALQRQDTEAAAQALGAMLDDADPSVRRQIVSALRRMHTAEARKVLQRAETTQPTKTTSARATSESASDDVLQAVVHLLKEWFSGSSAPRPPTEPADR